MDRKLLWKLIIITFMVLLLVQSAPLGGVNNSDDGLIDLSASIRKDVWIWYDNYNDDKEQSLANAVEMETKIEGMGYFVNLISSSSEFESRVGSYDLIIVDNFAPIYSSTPDDFTELPETIPIIGMGDGGLTLFNDMLLETKEHASCGYTGTIQFFNENHPIATTPNLINDPFSIYGDNSGWHCVYSPSLDGSGLEFIIKGTDDAARIPLSIEKNRFVYWGFDRPLDWTTAGSMLMENLLHYLLGPVDDGIESTNEVTNSDDSFMNNSDDSILNFPLSTIGIFLLMLILMKFISRPVNRYCIK